MLSSQTGIKPSGSGGIGRLPSSPVAFQKKKVVPSTGYMAWRLQHNALPICGWFVWRDLIRSCLRTFALSAVWLHRCIWKVCKDWMRAFSNLLLSVKQLFVALFVARRNVLQSIPYARTNGGKHKANGEDNGAENGLWRYYVLLQHLKEFSLSWFSPQNYSRTYKRKLWENTLEYSQLWLERC